LELVSALEAFAERLEATNFYHTLQQDGTGVPLLNLERKIVGVFDMLYNLVSLISGLLYLSQYGSLAPPANSNSEQLIKFVPQPLFDRKRAKGEVVPSANNVSVS